MKYERRTKKVNAKKSVYKLTFPNELTEVSYNLDFKNDYAMLGMGINTAYLKFDDDIKIKNLARWGTKEILISNDNKVYEIVNNKLNLLLNVEFSEEPSVIEYVEDCEIKLLISDGAKSYLLGPSEVRKIKMPSLNNVISYAGMLFGSQKNKVYFSSFFDGTNWTIDHNGAGYVSIEGIGNVKELMVFDDRLYIFCEKGICYLTAYGDKLNYSLKYCNVKFNKYQNKTAKLVFGKIFFVADNVLYELKGENIKIVNVFINNYPLNFTNSTSSSFSKYYYLTFGCKKISQNMLLLCYDAEKEKGYVINTGGITLAYDNYVIDNNLKSIGLIERSNKIFSNKNIGYLKSKELTFNSSKIKNIKSMYVNALKNLTIKIQSETETKVFKVENGTNNIQVNMKGVAFKMEFYARGAIYLSYVDFEIETY